MEETRCKYCGVKYEDYIDSRKSLNDIKCIDIDRVEFGHNFQTKQTTPVSFTSKEDVNKHKDILDRFDEELPNVAIGYDGGLSDQIRIDKFRKFLIQALEEQEKSFHKKELSAGEVEFNGVVYVSKERIKKELKEKIEWKKISGYDFRKDLNSADHYGYNNALQDIITLIEKS